MMKSELSSATHSSFVVFGKFIEPLQAPGSSQMKDPAKCLMYNTQWGSLPLSHRDCPISLSFAIAILYRS